MISQAPSGCRQAVPWTVFDGVYHPVETLNDINTLSEKAFDTQADLLLEVGFWTRPNPRDPETALELTNTGFFRLTPSASSVTLAVEEPSRLPLHYWDKGAERFPTDAIATLNR